MNNERIRELAKDAGFDWHKHWDDDEHNRLEKFAELIVRECIEIVLDSSIEYTTRPQVAIEIEQHFGVEE